MKHERDCPEEDWEDDVSLMRFEVPDYIEIEDVKDYEGLNYIPMKGYVEVRIDYTPADDTSYDNSGTSWTLISSYWSIDWPMMISVIYEEEKQHLFKEATSFSVFDSRSFIQLYRKIVEHIQKEVDDWTPLDG